MIQSKFRLDSELSDFLNRHQVYGFKDKSSVVRAALVRLKEDLERTALAQSALLYAEQFAHDPDLQDLTDSAVQEWPQ